MILVFICILSIRRIVWNKKLLFLSVSYLGFFVRGCVILVLIVHYVQEWILHMILLMHVVIIILLIFTLSKMISLCNIWLKCLYLYVFVCLYFPHSYFALVVQSRQNYCLVFQKCNNPLYLFICLEKLCFEFISFVLKIFFLSLMMVFLFFKKIC